MDGLEGEPQKQSNHSAPLASIANMTHGVHHIIVIVVTPSPEFRFDRVRAEMGSGRSVYES
jgi:hypothetical protein